MTKAVKVIDKKVELASKQVNLKTLLKEATGTVVVIDRESVEKTLKALVKAKKKRLEDLCELEELDKKQLEELKEIEREFRENRYALQNVDKHNTSALNMAKKNNGAMIDELKTIIEPSETKAKTKTKEQDDLITARKEAEAKAEEERVLAIENKINDAKIFFEEELENARKSNDWTAYDKFYNEFEEKLGDLEELEFEGSEVLEKYKTRKSEVVALIEQATAQNLKDKELEDKANDLAKQAQEAEENKRRIKEFFGVGFMYNGSEFFKDEVTYTEEEIKAKTPEEFNELINEYKPKEVVAEIVEVEEKITVTNNEGVTFTFTPTSVPASNETQSLQIEEVNEFDAVAKIVCRSIEDKIIQLEEELTPARLINAEVKKQTFEFMDKLKKDFTELKLVLGRN